ncbi:hypothetical protein MKX01_008042 [Papaver californicum]|nr:hypothetical protein MKX01_008042 [Papaver californicum]
MAGVIGLKSFILLSKSMFSNIIFLPNHVRPEGDGCGDLIVESGLCDNWGCGYYTCIWDEWRKKPRCICH